MQGLLASALFLIGIVTSACSGGDGGNSSGAGNLASASSTWSPPFAWGNTCTQVFDSSYGPSHSEKRTPLCLENRACWDDAPDPGYNFDGTAAYHSVTYYEDVVWFEGTCDNPKPVSCAGRGDGSACSTCSNQVCCGPTAICIDDPNCVALAKCLLQCNGRSDCQATCNSQADYVAQDSLQRFEKCLSNNCATECSQ
jgi:hypothetical protein